MLSVLIAHNYYRGVNPSGENVVFEAEAELLSAKGHAVYKYVRRSDELGGLSSCKRALLIPEMMWSQRSYREIKRIVADMRPDVAHFHNTFPLISVSALRACRESGVPVVQTLHNYRPLCLNGQLFRDGKVCRSCIAKPFPWAGIVHRCYRGSLPHSGAAAVMKLTQSIMGSYSRDVDVFIAPSECLRQTYITAGYPAAKIKVKPHFVDVEIEPYEGERQYALFVGRLSPEKGLSTVLSAWRRLPHIPLMVLGDGPQAEELKRVGAQLENVTFLGGVSRSEVLSYVQRANCLIVASQVPETFGLVAIEALACSTPVVASKMGALPEIIVNDRNGLLWNGEDEEDLAAKVGTLWADREYARALGANARRDYETRFTARANYEQLVREYSEVAGAHA